MGVLSGLAKALGAGITGKRTWTPAEVRELIGKRQFDEAHSALEQLSTSLRDRQAERACLLGEISFQEQRDADAAAAFQEALSTSPGMPDAHLGLSLLLAAQGKFDLAAQHAQFALTANRAEPRFLAQLGYCHLCLGNFQIAEAPLLHATRLAPDNGHAWNNLGIVLRSKGRLQEARDCFQHAARLLPDSASASAHLEQIEAEITASPKSSIQPTSNPAVGSSGGQPNQLSPASSEDLQSAIDACEGRLMDEPDNAEAVMELSELYGRTGDPQSGIDSLEAYLSRRPDQPEVRLALGRAYLKAEQPRSALPLLGPAHEHEPDRIDILTALAQTYSSLERFQEAGPLIERAHQLAPDDTDIMGQYAATLINMCRYDDALAVYEKVRSLGKEIGGYGNLLSYLGRFDEAIDWLDRALVFQSSDPNLRFQRATIHLLQHQFELGWDDYAYRGLSYSKNFRVLPFPHWRGEALEGKRIVVLAEQGLGDQVMFASCLPDLIALRPAEIVVEVIGRIAPTIARSFPECRVIASLQDRNLSWVKECPGMDYFVPLGDLPFHFRRSLDSFPRHTGYLRPDPARVAYWRGQLEMTGPGPYIGVSWRGGTEVTRTSLRSMQASQLAPLAGAKAASWISLQYGAVDDALVQAREAGFPMTHWPAAIADLDEFAALIGALDLVVTVCNTTVHYAGALGQPVWILAPQIPEWRYGVDNTSMPWYPSSRLFRQDAAGKWDGAIESVCRELSTWQSASPDFRHK